MPLSRGKYPATNPDFLWGGGATMGGSTNAPKQTLPRYAALGEATLTDGQMYCVGIALQEGDQVNTVVAITGGTAAASTTNQWMALYDATGGPTDFPLMAQSVDMGSGFNTANMYAGAAFNTPVQITRSGIYYIAMLAAAGTMPTVVGAPMLNATLSGIYGYNYCLAFTAGESLTDTAPDTMPAGTAVANVPFALAI